MKETKAIVKKQPEEIIPLTEQSIKQYISQTATTEEIALFLNQCKMFKLNPFKREIYLIKYSEKDPAQFVISYEVYLKRAEATGKLDGWEWGTEGEPKTPEFKAWIRIWRKDWSKPFYHEVFWDEYAKYRIDYKSNLRVLTKFWDKSPRTQLKKTVASQGFRLCFEHNLGNMPYAIEEMPFDDEKLPTAEVKLAQKLKEVDEGEVEEIKKEAEVETEEIKDAEVVAEEDEKLEEELAKEEKPVKKKPKPKVKEVVLDEPESGPEQPEKKPSLLSDEQKKEVWRLLNLLVDKYKRDPGDLDKKLRERFKTEDVAIRIRERFKKDKNVRIPDDLTPEEADLVITILGNSVENEKSKLKI